MGFEGLFRVLYPKLAATATQVPPELHEHVLAVWFEMLYWLGDSRGQQLQAGGQATRLLVAFLASLEQHVQQLLLGPQDGSLTPGASAAVGD